MTGYANYTRAELVEMDSRLMDLWRSERRACDGDGLRSEVARASVREIERQRTAINEEIAKRHGAAS